MTASGMEESERVEDGADATDQRYSNKEVEGVKRSSVKDPKRDSLHESKRASLREMKKDSFEETRRPNLRDLKKDSIHDSKRDSLRDSKRDSLIESGRDSPRVNSRRESGKDSPRKDSERRNTYSKGQDGTKTAAERKRSSGRSLDKNISKKEKNLKEDEKKPDGEMVETASMAAKRKALVMERRMLCGCTGLVGLAALVWLTAVCTESWFTVHAPTPEGLYINATSRYFLYSTSGLFRLCRYARRNDSSPVQKVCWLHDVFPTEDRLRAGVWVDRTIINYTRTEIFFSILSFILMVMGFLFSIYTFRNPRYMFKRLAAGIHFMSGATVMVVIEVLINSIDYERLSLNVVHPKEAYHTFGYSFYLGWVVFIFNSFASITFLVYSKKRKGDKAPTEEIALADEPTIIGR